MKELTNLPQVARVSRSQAPDGTQLDNLWSLENWTAFPQATLVLKCGEYGLPAKGKKQVLANRYDLSANILTNIANTAARQHAQRIDIVADQYSPQSIKYHTREGRKAKSAAHQIRLNEFIAENCSFFWLDLEQAILHKVNKQDFLQVFQGSGIGKMGDQLTSADPLSYTTNGSGESLVSFSCIYNPTPTVLRT